ncbi:unnamed protein product, partial [Staurois parvus]
MQSGHLPITSNLTGLQKEHDKFSASDIHRRLQKSLICNVFPYFPVQGTCSTTAKDLQDSIALVQCPSDCMVNGRNAWGTDVYTDDSSICKAAIHVGILDNNVGLVTVEKKPGLSSYT